MPPSMSSAYSWTCSPLVANAPMRLIALAPIAVGVSQAGGLDFIAAGTDGRDLKNELQQVADMLERSPTEGTQPDVLPIGVGFITWGVKLHTVLEAFSNHIPAAAWLFAPNKNEDLVEWTQKIRARSRGKTEIWIQIGSVSDAFQVAKICHPDVLVVQGADAGGHGLAQGAGIINLLPEVADALEEGGFNDISLVAAGGIVEGRGTAACLALGANGVVLGTRFLTSCEANIAKGYQNDVLRASDGGLNTVRTSVYDQLRATTGWPSRYNGRSIINQSFLDAQNRQSTAENKRLYEMALREGDQGWGTFGRLTAYAGAGVGLVKEIKSAPGIVDKVRRGATKILSRFSTVSSKL